MGCAPRAKSAVCDCLVEIVIVVFVDSPGHCNQWKPCITESHAEILRQIRNCLLPYWGHYPWLPCWTFSVLHLLFTVASSTVHNRTVTISLSIAFILHVLFICPIVAADNTGQIVKLVCVCTSVYLSVRLCTLSRSHFLVNFHQNWHRCKNPKSKNEFVWVNITPSLPLFSPKPPFYAKKSWKFMQILVTLYLP